MIENKDDRAWGSRGYHHRSLGPIAESSVGERSAIRQIAVHVAKAGGGLERLDLAVHLAKALDAQLIGVGTSSSAHGESPEQGSKAADILLTPFSIEFPRGSQKLQTIPEQRSEEPIKLLEETFWERANLCSGPSHRWQIIEHGNIARMVAAAKMSDLTILGGYASKSEPGSPGFVVEDVAAASGKPVLAVPASASSDVIGSNIMIAWNGSRGAVRALHDAMPLMRDARHITILEINRDRNWEDPDAEAAVSYLAHHGFQAFAEVREVEEESVCEQILTCATAAGADLMVAGLSLQSKIRATLLGSVGHELLRHAHIPLLVSC